MSDPRFARLKTDPRFRRIKKDRSKVVVDERFKGIFDDKGKKKSKKAEKGTPDNLCQFSCLFLTFRDDQRASTSTGGLSRMTTSRTTFAGSTASRTKTTLRSTSSLVRTMLAEQFSSNPPTKKTSPPLVPRAMMTATPAA